MVERPAYADYEAPQKFQAIQAIIMQRLREHPKAIASYSGGSDSDIMIHLIETARQMLPSLPPVKYLFFNTGLEMKVTKDHVKETAQRYGVEIETVRPKTGIVNAVRKYGQPFMSKTFSERLGSVQTKRIPLNIVEEFEAAENKAGKFDELLKRFPKCVKELEFLCSYIRKNDKVDYNNQFAIGSKQFFLDFFRENPPTFQMSKKCCECCKKRPAHENQKDYEMVITGERKAEGGPRSALSISGTGCFSETESGQFRLRPLYWVSDADKEWYKDVWGIRYSDAYEVYGMKRTGCCGCPISYRATEDLEIIRQYEPNLVKAAWNVFGDSYRYRQAYNEYKARRREKEKQLPGQIDIDELLGVNDGDAADI